MIPDAQARLANKEWLRQQLKDGLSVRAIAGTLGCEEKDLQRALTLHDESVPSHPWTYIERQVVLDLYEKYGRMIADAMYRNHSSVWDVAKSLDMDPSSWNRQRGYSKADRRKSFWQEWQLYILRHLEEWVVSGHWDDVRMFVFHPGLEPEECDLPQDMIDRLALEGQCAHCKYAELCHTNLSPLCTNVTLRDLKEMGEVAELLHNILDEPEGVSWG
jgi:hypothetical protein